MIPYIHLGFFDVPTFGLLMWVAFVAGFFALRSDLERRHLHADAQMMVLVLAFAGLAGSKLYHVLESPSELLAAPFSTIFSTSGFAWYGGFIAGALCFFYFARKYKVPLLLLMDAAASATALGYAVGRIGCLLSGDGDYGQPTSLPWGMSFPDGLVPTTERVHPTPIYEFIVGVLIFWYLWRLGAKAVRGPRPQGQVVAELFILMGVARFLVEFVRINPPIVFGLSNAQLMSVAAIVGGLVMLSHVKKQFRAQKSEHRILEHHSERGDILQPEYHKATPECPNPEKWKMYDSMTAEVEVLEFLRTMVTTAKPNLVVETGTFMGVSTMWIAEGLQKNGFGKVITCEFDLKVFTKAQERFSKSGLSEWIECRNESSLEIKVNGKIDLLFSDSDPPLREQEVRRFLPQMNPNGIILMHDASSHLKTVREAALRLEAEGLISVVLMPTPRGLVVAQKREGRA